MDETKFFQLIRQFVSLGSDFNLNKIIEASTNRKASDYPQDEYATIKVSDAIPFGSPDVVDSDGDGVTFERSIIVSNYAEVRIQFFKGDAYNHAKRLFSAQAKENIVQFCFENGIGIKEARPAMRIPSLANSAYENRAFINFVFWFNDVETEIINVGNKINISVNGRELNW